MLLKRSKYNRFCIRAGNPYSHIYGISPQEIICSKHYVFLLCVGSFLHQSQPWCEIQAFSGFSVHGAYRARGSRIYWRLRGVLSSEEELALHWTNLFWQSSFRLSRNFFTVLLAARPLQVSSPQGLRSPQLITAHPPLLALSSALSPFFESKEILCLLQSTEAILLCSFWAAIPVPPLGPLFPSRYLQIRTCPQNSFNP